MEAKPQVAPTHKPGWKNAGAGCPKYHLYKDMLFSYNEKLLSITEKKPVDFQKLDKGLNWYTWKK